jgi:hypothetical protein
MNTKEQTFIIKQYATSSKAFPTIKFEMPESSSLDDVIEAFEAFLVGVTFELPKGARLGLIYDEETEKKKVEEKYGLTTGSDSAPATPQTTWPETWSITHPILSTPIGSIVPATTWSTTTDSGCNKPTKKKSTKKKKTAKKKKKNN